MRGAFRPWKFRGSDAPELKEDKHPYPTVLDLPTFPDGGVPKASVGQMALQQAGSFVHPHQGDHQESRSLVPSYVRGWLVANWTDGLLATAVWSLDSIPCRTFELSWRPNPFKLGHNRVQIYEGYLSIWCNQRRVSWVAHCWIMRLDVYYFIRLTVGKGVVREVEICSERWIHQH